MTYTHRKIRACKRKLRLTARIWIILESTQKFTCGKFFSAWTFFLRMYEKCIYYRKIHFRRKISSSIECCRENWPKYCGKAGKSVRCVQIFLDLHIFEVKWDLIRADQIWTDLTYPVTGLINFATIRRKTFKDDTNKCHH